MKKYRVFKRSATGWETFASARKITIRRGLTIGEARQMCAEFNDNRSPAQVRKGTKLEFTEE
jgi:hypothetical protein